MLILPRSHKGDAEKIADPQQEQICKSLRKSHQVIWRIIVEWYIVHISEGMDVDSCVSV